MFIRLKACCLTNKYIYANLKNRHTHGIYCKVLVGNHSHINADIL